MPADNLGCQTLEVAPCNLGAISGHEGGITPGTGLALVARATVKNPLTPKVDSGSLSDYETLEYTK